VSEYCLQYSNITFHFLGDRL